MGRFFYWTATIVAGLIVMWLLWVTCPTPAKAYLIISITPLALAGAIWLTGWFCRNLSPHSN
jgi:hypothetical protein